MSNLVYNLIGLPIFTTGRRRFALARVLVLARDSGDVALVDQLEQAIRHEDETLLQEDAWRRSRNASTARGQAAVCDAAVDRIISAIARHLEAAMEIESAMLEKDVAVEDQPAHKLYGQFFPEGVPPVINQPHEEQLSANDGLLRKLTSTFKAEAQTLGLARYVEALGRANEAFRVELKKQPKPEISFDVVQAARDRGNLNLRMTVAHILGASTELTPEADAQRATLLAPINEQVRRIQAARRGRRRVIDVDPTTGEDLPTRPGDPVDEV